MMSDPSTSALLQAHRERKERLMQKRDEILKELEETERQIIEAQQDYGILYNANAAVVKLPNEILITIFKTAQEENKSIHHIPQNPLVEVTISHVCAQWRRLIISVPSFWNVFRYQGDDAIRLPIDRLEAYLERSKQYPLDLWFDFTGVPGYPQQFDMLTLVVPHLARCRRFHVLSDQGCPIEGMAEQIQNERAAILQELTICPDSQLTTPDFQRIEPVSHWTPSILLSGAPSLTYLRLDCTSFEKFRPPLDHIVHLRLEKRQGPPSTYFTHHVYRHILSLPNLETLSLFGQYFFLTGDVVWADVLPFEAPHLRHFRCGNITARESRMEVEYFFNLVSAPNLETLTFHGPMAIDVEHVPLAEDYFYPKLESFSWVECIIPPLAAADRVIRPLIRKIQNITKLTLTGPEEAMPHGAFFGGAMVMIQEGKTVLPRLETLIIEDMHVQGVFYRRMCETWSKLRVVKLRQALVDLFSATVEIPEGAAKPSLEALKDDEPFIPLHWPPGFDWMDNVDDPFIRKLMVHPFT